MTRIRVLIATTEGPVAVQKITAEDPDVPSVACRDGTTEVLAISRDYTRFVDRGTGLVAGLTGHGAYRLDLDRPVDGGRSWQLPVLLAHLLDAEGRLAGPDEPAGLIVLATGEVDRGQRVRPVGRIGEKLAAAQELIARHGEGGPPLVVLLPAADRSPDLQERLPDGAGTGAVRILAWERVMSLAALEEPTGGAGPDSGARGGDPGAGEPAERRSFDPSGRSPAEVPEASLRSAVTGALPPVETVGGLRGGRVARTAGVVFLMLAMLGAGVGAWWTGPRHWEALRRGGGYEELERALRQALVPPLAERFRTGLQAKAPPPESLVFSLVEQRTADGRPCAGQGFRSADDAHRTPLTETPVAAQKPGFFRSEGGASLCEAVYRVANDGERLVYLYFSVRPVLPTRSGETGTAAPLRRAAALPPGASLTLDLELGRQSILPLGADLLILAAPSPAPQLRRAFESAAANDEARTAEGDDSFGLTALPALGLTIKGASHAILR